MYFPLRMILKQTALMALCVASAYGQQTAGRSAKDDSVATNSRIMVVIVQGNEKTKEEIITREMKLKPGDEFDLELAQQDQLRIQNLGIFNRVEIANIQTGQGVILVVTVSEMWYIFPYPIIFRNDRDWSRISIGAGLLYTNFRGRREIIDFNFWLGFNPSIRLSYSNPWIFGKLKFYTSFSVFARKVRNRSFTVLDSDVDEKQLGFNWRLGKRFGHFTYFDVNLGYKQLSLSPNETGRTLSASGKDRLPQIGFSFKYDSRDLWEYAHKGNYVNFWLTKTGLFSNVIDYVRFGADLRKYLPIGPTTLAFRGATNLSQGTIPIYDQVHFGFVTRIRGHFRERRSGENLLLGSAEFRFPIRKITYHDWGPFQSMGRYGTNFRFGISGGLFVDTGALWFQNQDLTTEKFISGWGAGLHVFLPYNNLIRLEYAFDEDWNGQFIIDALITF
ncbi:MAG: POTRA domain-containing protein [bacterium]